MFRIGIDLDNTIISYHKTIYSLARKMKLIDRKTSIHKDIIKQTIFTNHSQTDAAKYWSCLQALCYGPHLKHATVSSSFYKTAQMLKSQGCELYIVSHKSKKSLHDPSIDLHHYAQTFLLSKKISRRIIPSSHIFFEKTHLAKIERLAQLNLDFIIDDHDGIVLSEKLLNSNNIHFGHFSSLNQVLALKNWDIIFQFFSHILISNHTKELKVTSLPKNNRNELIRLESDSLSSLLKIFSKENIFAGKCKRETQNLRSLATLNTSPVLIAHSKDMVHMEFIKGEHPTSYSDDTFQQVLTYFSMSKQVIRSKFIPGNDSRNRIKCYRNILMKRYKQAITSNKISKSNKKRIDNLYKSTLSNFNTHTKLQKIKLTPNMTSFCHSDFSCQNAILHNNILHFIDYESAGLDDPAKFLCDLLLHPNANFSPEQEKRLYFFFSDSSDKYFSQRFQLVYPMVALEWLLIKLNYQTEINPAKSPIDSDSLFEGIDHNLEKLKALEID